MNCHKREANNLDIAKAGHHQPHGDRDAQRAEHHQPDWETNGLPQGETHELETAKAGHHQPDWETNESVYGETNELETAERPDTTGQIGKQMSCHKGRQMNWRQPKSRTPLARLGDKCIATRGNKWIGDSRRPGHHQPSWIETGRKPDATSQTGRQMNCHKREANNLDIAKAGHHQPHGDRDAQRAEHHQPDWETNGLPQGETHELETAKAGHHQPDWETNESVYGETNELETAERPDTTSQTGKQMSCHKGKQMTWRQPESRTPPARLGDKSIATREDKWIGDSRQHRKPDTTSQTGRQMNCHKPETNELETAREPDTTSQTGRQVKCHEARQMNWRQPKPDTTSQIGRQMSCHKGRQMNWRQPKSRTPPARLGNKWVDIRGQMNSGHPESQTPPSEHSRTPLERELRTPTVNCLGTDGRHRAQGGGHSPWHKADTS